MDDWSLLQQYVRDGSKESLDEVVRRHLAMVHAAALRQVRDAHLADDVTQAVFLELMRSAPRISSRVVVDGWLYRTTGFAARKALRSRWRRERHENKAAAMKPMACEPEFTAESQQQLMNVLDDAMARLASSDRDAVVLRYLEGKSCREVAEAQRISEDAARQRLSRALGKLRARLARRGLAVPQDVLGTALTAVAMHQPPAELAGRVISAMRQSSGATGLTTVSRIINMAKAHPIAFTAGTLLICLGGVLAHFAWSSTAESSPSVAAAPTAAPKVLGTPTDTFVTALSSASNGDVPTFLSCFHHLTPAQTTQLQEVAQCMGTGTDLRKAVAAKFGDNQANALVMQLGFFPPIPPGALRTAVPIINGDKAQLAPPGVGAVTFTKTVDGWKLDPGLIENSGAVQHFSRLAPSLPGLHQIIADISAGKYADMHAVRFATNSLMAKVDDTVPPPDLPARPAALAPGATPKQTIAALCWASMIGDADAAVACYDNPSAQQREGIIRGAKIGAMHQEFRKNITDAFGNFAARNASLTLGLETGLTGTLLANAPETQDGNTARVDLKGSAIDYIDLVKLGGVWKIDPKLVPPPNAQWDTRYDEYYLPAFKQLAADAKAGKYETLGQIQAVVKQLHTELKADYDRLVTQNGL